jgi:hypothetical protein
MVGDRGTGFGEGNPSAETDLILSFRLHQDTCMPRLSSVRHKWAFSWARISSIR